MDRQYDKLADFVLAALVVVTSALSLWGMYAHGQTPKSQEIGLTVAYSIVIAAASIVSMRELRDFYNQNPNVQQF